MRGLNEHPTDLGIDRQCGADDRTRSREGDQVPPNKAINASFDIVESRITTEKGDVVFRTKVRQAAGEAKPAATGKFEGSEVYAYVWPTSLNSGDIGFDRDQGIVALAVTFHPDFDDGAYGRKNRTVWHPHWVVLGKDSAAGVA
jgi:hypothetical protein